jgi:hypothetical protein
MSPLFGRREDDQTASSASADSGEGALSQEVARLDGLSLAALATEVMTKGFGPGAPGEDPDNTVTIGGPNINSGVTVGQIAGEFVAEGAARQASDATRLRLHRLIAEGVQALEHAGLIRTQMHTSMGSLDYALTRLGRSALERGEVERVVGGETG